MSTQPEPAQKATAASEGALEYDMDERWLVFTEPSGASSIVGRDVPPWAGVEIVAAWLLRPNPAELALAMSAAYKSVGSWADFDDTVLAFAEATLRELVESRAGAR